MTWSLWGLIVGSMDTAMDVRNTGLGTQIRAIRRARGLTLVQLAAMADLSHPFLSQLERGQARPSMASLERIARALGTSQVELMAAAADLARKPDDREPAVVRSDEGDTGPYSSGTARLLVHGVRRFHPMEFVGSNTDPGDFITHDEDEFVHVVEGLVDVDLGPHGRFRLTERDSLYFNGGTPHRWASPTGSHYRMFIVKQELGVHEALNTATSALSMNAAASAIGVVG